MYCLDSVHNCAPPQYLLRSDLPLISPFLFSSVFPASLFIYYLRAPLLLYLVSYLSIVKMSQTDPSTTESDGYVRHLEDLKALDELCVTRPVLLTIAQSFLPQSKKMSPIFEEVCPNMCFPDCYVRSTYRS